MGKGKSKQNRQSQGGGNGGSEGHKQQNSEENVESMEKSNERSSKDIVLKVYMHCEGCAEKVSKCLKAVDGVESVRIDRENQKVIVKGREADPMKVLKRVQSRFSRNAELISPIPKNYKKEEKKEEPKKKDAPLKTTVLKMYMHCEGCAEDIKRNLQRMPGIMSVEPIMSSSRVIVKGNIDPAILVEIIRKRIGKHAEVLKQEKSAEERKEEKPEKKTEEIVFHYPPQYSTDHVYPSQLFNDENVHSCVIT